jgi:hypothetical protein
MSEKDFRYVMPDGSEVEGFQVTDASLFQDDESPDWMSSKMLMTKGSADSIKTVHWLMIGDTETEIPRYGWIIRDAAGAIRAVDYEVMEAAVKVVKELPKIPDKIQPMAPDALRLAAKISKRDYDEVAADDAAQVAEGNAVRQAIIDSLTPEEAATLGVQQTQAVDPAEYRGADYGDDEDVGPVVGSRMTYCSICSCKFDADNEGIEGDIGIIPVAFCSTCKAGIRDFAEQMWDLAPTGQHQTLRIPFHTFKNPVCRGDPTLGNNCGHCEKCEWLAGNAD